MRGTEWRRGIAAFCAAMSAMAVASAPGFGNPPHMATVVDFWAERPPHNRFLPTDVAQMNRAEAVFAAAFSGERDFGSELRDMGYEAVAVAVAGRRGPVLGLRELPDRRGGHGLFFIRARAPVPVLISVPHQYRDLDTGAIAAMLIDEEDFAAAAFNTAPRDVPLPAGGKDADLAHIPVSVFAAFHVAFARTGPAARVVQLHGFASEKRTSAAGRLADVILSSGSRVPGSAPNDAARCLRALQLRVAVYPTDLDELGGTTNANRAAMVGALGSHWRDAMFLHVEMARDLRRDLVKDRALRGGFARCLAGSP